MNLIKNLFKNNRLKDEKRVLYIITERLKPWIVLNCLEKENYIITDKQAENLAITIINQAISLNVLTTVLKKIKVI